MDETVYQCPECNFNTDNLNNLNNHILELHENENDDFNDSLNSNNNTNAPQYEDDIDDDDDDDDEYLNGNGNNGHNHNQYSDEDVDGDDDATTPTSTPFKKKSDNNTIILKKLQLPVGITTTTTTPPQAKQIPNTDNHYERQYSCKYCSFYTNNPRAILYHRKNEHNEKIPVYECTYCQYASQYSGKVERHTLLRHKIDIANAAAAAATAVTTTQENENTSTTTTTTTTTAVATTDDVSNSAINDSITASATTGGIAFQCTKCPCKYKRSNDLYKHLRLKHSGCGGGGDTSITDDAAESNSSFNNNVNDSTGGGGYDTNGGSGDLSKLECPYCTYTSQASADYLLHIKEHLGGKTFRCILCNAIYKYRGDCVVHLKRKHQKADLLAQNYVQRIDVDTINLSSVYSMLKPKMYDDIDNDDKLFGCCYCDYKANYKGDVYKHQTRRHPGTMKNARTLLNASSNHQQSQDQQQQQHEDDDEVDGGGIDSTAAATACATSGITRYHHNYNHQYEDDYDDSMDETPPLPPPQASTTSAQLDEYNDEDVDDEDDFRENGYDQSDTSALLYECKLCPYKAKNSAKLQFHMSTHDNLKLYMCPICKKRANFKWDIQKHLRKVHDSQADVVCLSVNEARQTIDQYIEYYGNGANSNVKRFSSQQQQQNDEGDDDEDDNQMMMMHQQPHQQQQQHNVPSLLLNPNIFLSKHSTRERKYKCSLCNRTSKWQWDIRKHMRTVHKDQTGDVVVLSDKDLIKKLTENPSYSRTLALMNSQAAASTIASTENENSHFATSTPSPVSSVQQQQHQHHLQSPPPQVSLHSNYVSIGSDSTGNKKFKCTLCPYRSNWKADLFRHIRKRHSINQPSIDDVIILSPDEAAASIGDYEQTHGIYIRKRSRIDLDTSGTTPPTFSSTNGDHNGSSDMSMMMQQQQQQQQQQHQYQLQKSQRVLLPSNENYQQQEQHQHYDDPYNESSSMNGSEDAMMTSMERPTTTVVVKTFQCIKCTYKTIRKSDLLRHLKVRHSLYTNLNRYFKTITATATNHHYHQTTAIAAQNNSSHEQQQQQQHLPSVVSSNGGVTNGGVGAHAAGIVFHKNFYKCTYCLFKHINKAMVKKHLMTHQLKTNGFKCNICSYKSEWRYSVKKHIISTHWLVPNAAVVKCTLRPSGGGTTAVATTSNNNNNGTVNNENHNQNDENNEIKNEFMDISSSNIENHNNENENENNNENTSINGENNKTTENNASQQHQLLDDEESEIQQQIAAVKPSSFESSKLITPNGKSYTSAFVTVNSNGAVVNDPNDANYTNCTKKKMYFCESCPYKTNNYCNLKQHLLQHRPEAGHAKCRYCPYYVSMSRLLKQHEILHPEYIPRERDLNNLSLNTSIQTPHQQQHQQQQQQETTSSQNTSGNNTVEIIDQDEQDDDDEMNAYQQQQSVNKQQQQQQRSTAVPVASSSPIQMMKTANSEEKQQQSANFRIYRCKYCPFTSTDTNDAKAHGYTHMIEQQKAAAQAAAAAAVASIYSNEVNKNKKIASSSSTSSSTSTSPSPSPQITNGTSTAQQQHQNNTSKQQQYQLTPQQAQLVKNTQAALNYHNPNQLSNIQCQFCEHVSKNSFQANHHLLYHLNSKTNMPKNFLFETQLRQLLNMQAAAAAAAATATTTNPLNYALPQMSAAAAAFSAAAQLATQFPVAPLLIPQQPPQQKSRQQQPLASNKPQLNGNRSTNSSSSSSKTAPEYIDISEYEKFFAVLQEAADQQ